MDQSVLDRLKEELNHDGDGYTRIFVANFLNFLPHRHERLRLALTTGDLQGAVDAALSLKTSAQMVGAERLAALAMDLEAELRSEATRSDVTAVLPRLAVTFLKPAIKCSRQTIDSLSPYGSEDFKR
ncbi:Hpt domain-containing protein [Pseudarthrobacter sp. NS4]|uniref:Hpt domain-containing protein n=1 Tax=Pseudarthrobacter sp. NS4 TaxID=2973976 RepID=UPI002867E5C6|nr:Hpt domain-containing protein [Pseudarthrobacter sp. NS4]